MTWTTKEARAWVAHQAAAFVRRELEEDARWLTHDANDTPLDEFAVRRVRRAASDFVKKNTLDI